MRFRNLIALPILLVSCLETTAEPDPFNFDDLFKRSPINDVSVYLEFAEVDDTVSMYASGFTNGSGFGTEFVKTAVWSPSDPTAMQVVSVNNFANNSRAVLLGLKPGLILMSVTLNGVTGSGAITILPHIKQLRLKSTRTTLAIGDTVEVWMRADDVNGDSIPGFRKSIGFSFGLYLLPIRYVGPFPRERYVGADTGTVRFYTNLANDTASISVRVVPPTP